MTRIDDPDFGPIDVESTSAEAWKEAEAKVTKAIHATRHWPPGTTHTCPRCREQKFHGSDDVSYQTVDERNHVHTFYNLRGAHCSNCGLNLIEPSDLIKVEKVVQVQFTPVFSGKVSNVGRGTLGTYWSRDVERNLGLHAGDRLDVELVGKDAMLVRVRHEHKKGESSPRAA